MDSTTWILLILLLLLVGIVVFWLLRRPGDDGEGEGVLDARDHDGLAGRDDRGGAVTDVRDGQHAEAVPPSAEQPGDPTAALGQTGPAPLAEPVGGSETHQQPDGTADLAAPVEDGQVAPTESRYDAQPAEPAVEDAYAPADGQDASEEPPRAPVVDEQDGSLEGTHQPVDEQQGPAGLAYQPVDDQDVADEPTSVGDGAAPREAEAPEFTDPAAAQEPTTEPLTAEEVLAAQDTTSPDTTSPDLAPADEYPVGDDATTYRAQEGQAVVLDDDGSVRQDDGADMDADVYPGGDGSVTPLTDGSTPVAEEPPAQDDGWDTTDTARAAGAVGAAGAASPGDDQRQGDLWEAPDTAPADAPVSDDTWVAPEASTTETTVADERHDDTWVTPDTASTEASGTDQRQDETWVTPDTAPTDVPPTEPTSEAPVVEEPVVEEPVVEEPVVDEPVVEEPVVEEPVVEEPPAEAAVTDEPPTEAEVGAPVFAESIYGAGSAEPLEDGTGPAGWSVKGNTGSMLFHTPDSPSYEGVRAEVWFESEDAARAAGFAHWDRRRR